LQQVNASSVSILRMKLMQSLAEHGGTLRRSIQRMATVENDLRRFAVFFNHLVDFGLENERRVIDATRKHGGEVRGEVREGGKDGNHEKTELQYLPGM